MRRSRNSRNATYLNAILTVNAVMVAALVWTHVSEGPSLANASPLQAETGENTGGVPNAGLQRLQTLNEIKALRSDVQRLEATLVAGKIRFGISNFAELKKMMDESQAQQKAAASTGSGTGTATVAPSGAPVVAPATAPKSNP
jgi:hypothetical protein